MRCTVLIEVDVADQAEMDAILAAMHVPEDAKVAVTGMRLLPSCCASWWWQAHHPARPGHPARQVVRGESRLVLAICVACVLVVLFLLAAWALTPSVRLHAHGVAGPDDVRYSAAQQRPYEPRRHQ